MRTEWTPSMRVRAGWLIALAGLTSGCISVSSGIDTNLEDPAAAASEVGDMLEDLGRQLDEQLDESGFDDTMQEAGGVVFDETAMESLPPDFPTLAGTTFVSGVAREADGATLVTVQLSTAGTPESAAEMIDAGLESGDWTVVRRTASTSETDFAIIWSIERGPWSGTVMVTTDAQSTLISILLNGPEQLS